MSSPTQQLAQAPNVGQVAHELETGLTDALHLPGDAEYERQRDSFHGAPDAVVDTETVARRPGHRPRRPPPRPPAHRAVHRPRHGRRSRRRDPAADLRRPCSPTCSAR